MRERFDVDDRGFLVRDGPARARGEQRCHEKLCFTAVDVDRLAAVLHELGQREDCWFVKLDAELGRHGMTRGRCFPTSAEAGVAMWKRHEVTDHVRCTIQDDEFTVHHR